MMLLYPPCRTHAQWFGIILCNFELHYLSVVPASVDGLAVKQVVAERGAVRRVVEERKGGGVLGAGEGEGGKSVGCRWNNSVVR